MEGWEKLNAKNWKLRRIKARMGEWENLKTPRTGGCNMSNAKNLEEERSQVSGYEGEKKSMRMGGGGGQTSSSESGLKKKSNGKSYLIEEANAKINETGKSNCQDLYCVECT
jgi:hypothetical protein